MSKYKNFSRRLLNWFEVYGRHDLPWQQEPTSYRVWISEIMLQQTQVKTVIPYFNRFIKRFPDIESLADADLNVVLYLWSGLGYYARARNLHKSARIIREKYNGIFPDNSERLQSLPGIGRSTAGAILAMAGNQHQPILDGNVKRVLTRYHAVPGWPGSVQTNKKLWKLAEQHTPREHIAQYTQAIMDLGATICVRSNPLCPECPVQSGCIARQQGQQMKYPHKKTARKLSTRRTIFAILKNDKGEILLEQRPPTGIWGGLWSFPECPDSENLEEWVCRRLGYTAHSIKFNPVFRHSFTHYHLEIVPVHINVKIKTDQLQEAGKYQWYSATDKTTLGLATPVRKILENII